MLVEARPGAGKTTAAIRLADRLRAAGLPLAGFFTEEMREGGVRVGFRIETFEGERGVLAHVERRGPPRVGKYGVDLDAFERLALPEPWQSTTAASLALIDTLADAEILFWLLLVSAGVLGITAGISSHRTGSSQARRARVIIVLPRKSIAPSDGS